MNYEVLKNMKRLYSHIRLKLNNIIQIFCISLFLLNLIGILHVQQYYFHDNNVLSIELVISFYISSLILSILIFLSTFVKINNKVPFFIAFFIIVQHIFMLVYNLLNTGDFWEYRRSGIQIITLFSILTMIIAFYIMLLFGFSNLLPSKKNLYSMRLREALGKLSGWISSVWVYIPILAGILTPMFIYFPIAYISWEIFSFICKTDVDYYDYYNSWFVISPGNTSLIFILIVIETAIFIFGLFIFLYGLIHLVKARKTDVEIVQTGPYKYIRHPQNLGILIMMLPIALYIPKFIYIFLDLAYYYDIGIRIADILSWILFGLIIILICDYEERKMIKRFPNEYEHYRSKTGFFFPKIRKWEFKLIKNEKNKYELRYLLLILCFILIVIITNFIAERLYKDGIVEIYR